MLIRLGRRFEYYKPVVAVAAHRMHVAAAGQLHYVPERSETVAALFEKVAVNDKLILIGEVYLFKHTPEIFKIPVNIGNDKYPFVFRKPEPFDCCGSVV